MSEDLFEAYMDTVDQCKKTRVVTPAVQMAKASFQIRDAFAALRAAKLALYQASEKAISAKAALDKKRSGLLASGTIQGKNAETRDAQLAQECWQEMAALESAEADKRKAAHEADQAGLVVSEIQWLIRNDEATAALVRERII